MRTPGQRAWFVGGSCDHIVEIDGERAHLNAQFVVFQVRAAARPAYGRPTRASGTQGTVQPVESGTATRGCDASTASGEPWSTMS